MSTVHSSDDAAGLERVTATLGRLPVVDARAADRVLAAALAHQRSARRQRAWLSRAAGLALAVGVGATGALLYRGSSAPHIAQAPVAAAERAAARSASAATTAATTAPVVPPSQAQFAAAGSREEAPIATPFVLRRPGARRVSLVGDFDGWSPTAIPMTRDAGGTWTATVELTPGRHAYAFVVDDSVWVTDPRAEVVRDADYGRDHSVILVGRP